MAMGKRSEAEAIIRKAAKVNSLINYVIVSLFAVMLSLIWDLEAIL